MSRYRHELKYEITNQMAEILKKKLALLMNIDSNSVNDDNSYFIRSIYFDDINSTAYYEKIDGVEYRKKYRIRLYNNDLNFIRLECKHKHQNMTFKEQTLISKTICDNILNGDVDKIDFEKSEDLLKRFILDFKTQALRPTVIVDYNRVAFTYNISDVRITFDSNISSGKYNHDIYDVNKQTYKVLDNNKTILEVKFNEILPEPIANILSTIPMARQAFSKFSSCRDIM